MDSDFLTFPDVSAGLRFYYARLERLTAVSSLPLAPKEIDNQGRTDVTERLLVECLTVGVHMRGLKRLQRFVLNCTYGDHMSLNDIRQFIMLVNKHGFTVPWRTRPPRGGRRFDNAHLIQIRRDAERVVGRRMEERGLLG